MYIYYTYRQIKWQLRIEQQDGNKQKLIVVGNFKFSLQINIERGFEDKTAFFLRYYDQHE